MKMTVRPSLARALLALATLAACGAPPEATPGSAAKSAAPSAAAAASGAPSAAPSGSSVAASPQDQQAAEALLKSWLDAQNSGDFAAYEALYATKFEGVKRSGARTTRLDRKGWVADRKRMFEKKMAVSADFVAVVSGAGVSSVRFKQTWASGSFKDEGPKELVLVPEGGKLKIAREELFQSRVGDAAAQPKLEVAKLAFVLDGASPRVVLQTDPQIAWRQGTLSVERRGDPWQVRAVVDEPKLPAEISGWKGKELRLFGASGELCVATVSGFSFVARAQPHFGTVQQWEGRVPGEPPGKPVADATIAAEVFDLGDGHAPGGRLLTADLVVKSGDCKGALWARDASLPAPAVAKGEPAPQALREKALAAFRALPDYGPLDAAYAKEVAAPRAAHWEEHDKAAPPRVLVFTLGKQRFVGVSGSTQVGGCGEFSASLSAMFELQGDEASPRLVPIAGGWVPESIADVDGEGLPELIGREIYARGAGARWAESDALIVPNYDCEC